eukprot:XP_008185009.2 PREDICTED: UDP-glucuronosyltransferase 2B2 [Acyrthosiphon pisum]
MLSSTTVLIVLCAWPALLQWTPAGAANILAVQTIPGKSHWNVMRAVLQALTDRGHTVTVFTPFVDGDRDGYTEVDVSDKTETRLDLDAAFLIENYGTTRKLMANMVKVTRAGCDMIYEHRQMVDILNGTSAQKFNLVVTEPLVSECVAYAATPGHAPNPAVTGHVLFSRGVPETFAERFANLVLTVYCSTLTWYIEWQLRWADPRPYDIVDLVRPSIIFTNTHFITEPVRSLTPDFVQIGGIHLTPSKPIPKDILEFIENAPNGVIYFTFGSVVSMSSLPESVQSAFRKALARVPQKVLWKYEGEMADIPKNVMTRKWFPQRDILVHPNMKLFISHGGISGVYEAVDGGVPVLGFPFYYDQPRNIDNLVNAGMAISMDLLSVTEETFLNAVLEIVNNDRYQKNAKIASERFKDRPMSPTESVVYWTEYVLRHNGALHLKSHAWNLAWYQYFSVDVLSTFLLITFVFLFIIYHGLKLIYKYICNFCRKEKSE